MNAEEIIISKPLANTVLTNDNCTTKKDMENSENKNSFEWVWYVIGLLTGILAVAAVTFHIGYLFLGGIIGLILAGLFLNNIVKGREY